MDRRDNAPHARNEPLPLWCASHEWSNTMPRSPIRRKVIAYIVGTSVVLAALIRDDIEPDDVFPPAAPTAQTTE